MFDSATSTLQYRPQFGRRAPSTVYAGDTRWVSDMPPRSVDAITAELRQRILSTTRRTSLQIGRATTHWAVRPGASPDRDRVSAWCLPDRLTICVAGLRTCT